MLNVGIDACGRCQPAAGGPLLSSCAAEMPATDAPTTDLPTTDLPTADLLRSTRVVVQRAAFGEATAQSRE
jgi:hypothetical protein